MKYQKCTKTWTRRITISTKSNSRDMNMIHSQSQWECSWLLTWTPIGRCRASRRRRARAAAVMTTESSPSVHSMHIIQWRANLNSEFIWIIINTTGKPSPMLRFSMFFRLRNMFDYYSSINRKVWRHSLHVINSMHSWRSCYCAKLMKHYYSRAALWQFKL